MSKRSRGDALTGGTGDVNPQYISFTVTQSAANAVVEQQIPMPIVRIGPATKDSTIVMELLKVVFNPPPIIDSAAAATHRRVQFSLSSVTSGTTPTIQGWGSPTTVCLLYASVLNAFTAAGTGMLSLNKGPLEFDFTDGAGHGPLYAGDSMFFQFDTDNFAAAETGQGRLYYRMKRVSVTEYIGLMQSLLG